MAKKVVADAADHGVLVYCNVLEPVMAEMTEIDAGVEAGSEATLAPERTSQQDEAARRKDRIYLSLMAQRHGAAVVAVLTLFGAAHVWASGSDWLLAALIAPLVAFMAGTVLAAISHEWGHFAGARLAGAVSPVNAKPYRWFFIFNFDTQANSVTQGLWLSWGGQLGSWLLVLAVAALVPMDSLASGVLLATVLGRAVNASVFEFPIMSRVRGSGDLQKEIDAQLADPGLIQWPGVMAAVATLALVVF